MKNSPIISFTAGRSRRKQAGEEIAELAATPPEATETEAEKIKGAVRTDFVLSAEIIAITLGTVAGQDFTRQVLVLSAIAIVMTVGVYGLVAGIVKLDDAGLYLTQRKGALQQGLGRAILWAAPFLMKTLSIARHRRDVSRRRRHHHPRHSLAPPRHRTAAESLKHAGASAGCSPRSSLPCSTDSADSSREPSC